MIWPIIVLSILFLAAGTAIAYVFGSAAVLSFFAADKARYLAILPQRIFSQLDVFSLMAMALFILVGEIMNRNGVTGSLIRFAMSFVGRFKGGLGHVNILTSVFFAGVSGSAIADAASLSNTLIPAMRNQGYSKSYAGAVTAASAVIGPIIPPSIILIFYGALMQVSIGGLFAAGIIPGLLLSVTLFVMNAFLARKHDHPGGRDMADIPKFLPSFYKALPALMLPVIILGGIVFGVVTPTEAAGLAVVAALVAGFFYKGTNLKSLMEGIERTTVLTGSIFIILAAAACAGYIASLERWPQQIAELSLRLGLTGVGFLLLINFFFLVAGMVMDVPMALALLVPLFGPACLAQGVDPIHLGIVLCLNLTIGLITPPLGACLIVVSTISNENYWTLAKACFPFVVVEIAFLMLITLVPGISLYLPRLLGYL